MKRLFAALKIYPDADFLLSYRKLKSGLHHEHIKWVEEHNIHVTLKFFGETEELKIPAICSSLRGRAGMTSEINLQLSGLGIFGSAYAPKVIWVGISPFDPVSSLMKNIQRDLAALGFEADRQNLVPHLTLGRIKFLKDKVLFNRMVGQFKTIASAPLQIGEIILFESILHHEGPEYIALDRFPLKKELP
ncbi:MAG: RNA 2',3'-cyclic phosphodiesterase [Bacteroidota bacterium]